MQLALLMAWQGCQCAWGLAGDEVIRKANEARFTERLASSYASLRKERLASAEVLCRKQIQEFTSRLTQVGPASSSMRRHERWQRTTARMRAVMFRNPGPFSTPAMHPPCGFKLP